MEDYRQQVGITIHKFDINKVRCEEKSHTYPACVIYGKRNTGKTFLVKDLLYRVRDYPNTDIFVREETDKDIYSPMAPIDRVKVGWKLIGNVLNRQTAACATENDARAAVVLDDCFESHHVFNYPPLRQIMINSRHLKTTLISVMQYPIKFKMEMRANVDYIFICRTPVISDRKAIYKEFGGMFPTFDIFCQVLDACTNDYECLVIDNRTASYNIEDMIFWYKPAARGDFIMGISEVVERENEPKEEDVRVVVFRPLPVESDTEAEDDNETEE